MDFLESKSFSFVLVFQSSKLASFFFTLFVGGRERLITKQRDVRLMVEILYFFAKKIAIIGIGQLLRNDNNFFTPLVIKKMIIFHLQFHIYYKINYILSLFGSAFRVVDHTKFVDNKLIVNYEYDETRK